MKAIIIKGTIGVLSVGGLATGGYFGFRELNKEKSTIKDLLTKEGLTLFTMSQEGEWKTKFNTLRDDDNKITKLKAALQEVKGSSFEVVKSKENAEGGSELKKWCEAIFRLKRSETNGEKTIDNARILCAEPKG